MAGDTEREALTERSALELASLIREREVSPVEVARAFLARIERVDPEVHAFVTVTADLALAQAEEAERALAAPPEALGPLHGVPVAIKDLVETRGVRTTFNSRAFAEYVPEFDAEVVARLRAAGAVTLGKTNTPEFGLNATTEEGINPPTRNPWDPTRSAGGSSGGSAAALAARLCPLAEGSDGGGSIRIPAAACGVVGLKPSRGRVPSAPTAGEGWAGFATEGPLARTVADVALALDVLAGPALGDPYPTPNPDRSFLSAVDERPGRLRIGWTTASPVGPATAEVAEAVRRAAEALAAAGHEVVEGRPDTSGMWEPFLAIVAAHTAAMPLPDPDLLGPHARAVYEAGRALSAVEYLAAEAEVYQHCRRVLGWFERFDALLCPTLPRTAPPLGELTGAGQPLWDKLERFIPFTFWVNMTGQPAASLPLAWGSDGLPIGVQVVGRQLADRAVISLAAELERAFPWRDRVPPLARA